MRHPLFHALKTASELFENVPQAFRPFSRRYGLSFWRRVRIENLPLRTFHIDADRRCCPGLRANVRNRRA